MISFSPSEEQREFRDAVREFVVNEVRPLATHQDRLQAGPSPLPAALLAQASQMGLRTLLLSEALGGAGASQVTACIVAEELAAGDAGFASTLMHTAELGQRLFDYAMADAQHVQWLDAFVRDDAFHLAYAGADQDIEDGGWNYHCADVASAPVFVRADAQGSGWVLNGSYPCVNNAPLARLFVVRAETAAGSALMLVPADTAGLTTGEAQTPSGLSSRRWCVGPVGAVTFKDCRVPSAHVLAGCTSVYGAAASPLTQALNLGVGRAAYEAAVTYAKLRVQGGRLIVEHQAIGTILAETAMRIETARNLVWKVAWAADHPDDETVATGLPLQTLAKAYVSQAMQEATLLAAECFGAMGVMRDMTTPHYVNEARMFAHAGVSNATAKLRVAEAIAGFRRG